MNDSQNLIDADATMGSDGRARSGIIRSIAHWLASDGGALPDEGRLAPFDGATAWLNSDPLTPDALRGRVVLVDFWTYTCVNWIRTLPYVRAWAAKYAEAGLTVVGVHTPEFGFEADLDNVAAQTRKLGVEYPVVVDSDYRVWGAFANHFWPAVYIGDAEGRIRHHHFGEGEYAQTEMVIQRLLLDAGARDLDQDLVDVEPRGLEVAADWQSLRSPETYLGYSQSSGFASERVAAFDLPHEYADSEHLSLNSWDLSGNWTVARHAAGSNTPGARVAFQFHARDVNLVMGPRAAGSSIPFRVTLDGRPVDDAHGTDVTSDGRGVVGEQTTFQLIRQPGPIGNRRFEIEFLDAGIEVYCFTFG
ncbi:redoxin domain-containing protein [Agromyces sp. NPDC049794]|uniref:redoxin domain-containing protein n=1 Tax=unclassified Agromyces TaxID=2639701 RepID=UPI0033DED1DA